MVPANNCAATSPSSAAAGFIEQVVSGALPWQIAVTDHVGNDLGSLRPLTRSCLQEPALMARLAAWRNRARTAFLSQNEVTAESTHRWLRATVLNDSARMLFLVCTPDRPVGQLGFFKLTARSAELDNLLRGEIGGHPQLMRHAERVLLEWLFGSCGVERVTALVFADNARVIALHESLGFTVQQREVYRREELGGQLRYVPATTPMAVTGGRDVCTLVLRREDLEAKEREDI